VTTLTQATSPCKTASSIPRLTIGSVTSNFIEHAPHEPDPTPPPPTLLSDFLPALLLKLDPRLVLLSWARPSAPLSSPLTAHDLVWTKPSPTSQKPPGVLQVYPPFKTLSASDRVTVLRIPFLDHSCGVFLPMRTLF